MSVVSEKHEIVGQNDSIIKRLPLFRPIMTPIQDKSDNFEPEAPQTMET